MVNVNGRSGSNLGGDVFEKDVELSESEDDDEEDEEGSDESSEETGAERDRENEEEGSQAANTLTNFERSVDEWTVLIKDSGDIQELRRDIKRFDPFRQASIGSSIEPSQTLNDLTRAFLIYLNSGERVPQPRLRSLTNAIFGCCDVFPVLSRQSAVLSKWKWSSLNSWKNLFSFMKLVPPPNEQLVAPLFQGEGVPGVNDSATSERVLLAYEELFLAFIKCKMPTGMTLKVMEWVSDNLLEVTPNPHFYAQYFFSNFERGSVHSIFALEGIFQLVVKHNFEYPKFFEAVYELITPSTFYLLPKKKFLDILNLFLSSTHLASYIVASFTKRLSRILLFCPFEVQESIMGLIRNLITRHPNILPLMHRDEPSSVEGDPFDFSTSDLTKTLALESSLWEVKSIQRHFILDVAKRARFLEGGPQKVESFVRWRDADAYWKQTMAKAFGEELSKKKFGIDHEDEEEIGNQRGPKTSRKRTLQMYAEHASRHLIPISEQLPSGRLFPSQDLLAEYSSCWKV